jgi:hypothetical protein
LEDVVKKAPPRDVEHGDKERPLGGLFMGPTGIAYLFLHVSQARPELQISSHPARYWAEKYIDGDRGPLNLEEGCGIANELLAYTAVRACFKNDLSLVHDLITHLAPALSHPTSATDLYPTELLYGRTGALYLLRMVRHFVDGCADVAEKTIAELSERIMATDDDGQGNWLFVKRRYIGAGHGDIGILTQLLLTTPALASRLAPRLEQLIDLQQENGNWPKFVADEPDRGPELVQWCHGAP